jgi:hypothetical protein
VEFGGALFASCTLLGFGRAPLLLLRLSRVALGGVGVFRCTFALLLGLVVLLARGHGVGLSLLAVSGDLTTESFALPFALATALRRSSERQYHQRENDDDGGDDDDYGDG